MEKIEVILKGVVCGWYGNQRQSRLIIAVQTAMQKNAKINRQDFSDTPLYETHIFAHSDLPYHISSNISCGSDIVLMIENDEGTLRERIVFAQIRPVYEQSKFMDLIQQSPSLLEEERKRKYEMAWKIANMADVSSPPNSVVLFSTSHQPSQANKWAAQAYIAKHKGYYTLYDTECGRIMNILGLEVDFQKPDEKLMKIWAIAYARFIKEASGNVTAFVDNADPRSTFIKTELPRLLKNDRIALVNGVDKHEFAKRFI